MNALLLLVVSSAGHATAGVGQPLVNTQRHGDSEREKEEAKDH